MFARVLNKPTLILELLEVLGSLLIDLRVILAGAYGEVYLRLDDVVQALLVVTGLGASLFTVEYVVGTALHLLHQFLRWTYSLEWFYDCHDNN